MSNQTKGLGHLMSYNIIKSVNKTNSGDYFVKVGNKDSLGKEYDRNDFYLKKANVTAEQRKELESLSEWDANRQHNVTFRARFTNWKDKKTGKYDNDNFKGEALEIVELG